MKSGSLFPGQYLNFNNTHFKIKVIYDDKKNELKKITPSIPAHVVGISIIPNLGTQFTVSSTPAINNNIEPYNTEKRNSIKSITKKIVTKL